MTSVAPLSPLSESTIELITSSIKSLSINEIKLKKIILIQKWFRGCLLRIKQLPLIILYIQNYLNNTTLEFSKQNKDGRINSSLDENNIIELLKNKFINKIKIPKIRMWYDILVLDYFYGWIPINIKTTTTLTNDNSGNLAMCVYSYTDENLDLHKSKSYNNKEMSVLLIQKLNEKKYNLNIKKDYYFIVLNKNTKNIIINSIKGLIKLTPNINNLPFQICWNKNKEFKYEHIYIKIKLFIECIKNTKFSWKDHFMSNIKNLKF